MSYLHDVPLEAVEEAVTHKVRDGMQRVTGTPTGRRFDSENQKNKSLLSHHVEILAN